jgi:hypothetical protein
LLFRQVKQLRGNSDYSIRMALFYFMSVLAHNLVSAGTRCDAENNPPVRPRLCRWPFTLSLASSLCLAFFLCLLPPPLVRFSSLLFRSTYTFGLLAESLLLALFLFLSTLFGFP